MRLLLCHLLFFFTTGWNTSVDGHDPAQVPYTHSDSDPVSPSPDTLNRVTHSPDILGFGSGSPTVLALGGVSVQQGVGVSASDDKSRPPIPQESAHNGQEKAGAAISDLAHTVTHSPADTLARTQSTLSYTHAETHTVTQTAPPSLRTSAEAKSRQLLAHTLAGHDDDDVAMATSAHLNRETDNAHTVAQTQSLTKRTPPTESNKQTGTEIYSGLHNSTRGSLLNSTVSVASSHTVGLTADPLTKTNSTSLREESNVPDSYSVTNSDMSVTSSVDEGLSVVTVNCQNHPPNVTAVASIPYKRTPATEMDQTSQSLRLAQPNQESPLDRTQGTEMDQTSLSLGSANPNQDAPHNSTLATEMDQTSQSLASTKSNQETFFGRTLGTETNQTSHSLGSTNSNQDTLQNSTLATDTDQTSPFLRLAQPYQEMPIDRTPGTETDQTSRSMRSANPNQDAPYNSTLATDMDQTRQSLTSDHPNRDDPEQTQTSVLNRSSTLAVNTHNPTISDSPSHSEDPVSESPFLMTLTTSREETPPSAEQPSFETFPPNPHVEYTSQPATNVPSPDFTTTHIERTTAAKDSSTFLPSTINQSKPNTDPSSAFTTTMPATPSDLLRLSPVTSVERLTEKTTTFNPTLTLPSSNTVRKDGEREMSSTSFESKSISPSDTITHHSTHQVHPTVTSPRTVQAPFTTEEYLYNTSENEHEQFVTPKHQTTSPHIFSPHISTTAHSAGTTTAVPQYTTSLQTDHSTNDISHANSSQSGISLGPMIPVSISPPISTETGSTEPGNAQTESHDPLTPTNHSPVMSTANGEAVSTSIPSRWGTTAWTTTVWTRITPSTPTPSSNQLTTSRKTVPPALFTTEPPSTYTLTTQMNTNSSKPTGLNTASTVNNSTPWLRPFILKTDKDWSHKARVFVVEDQPAIIKVEMFQVLLQVVLEGNPHSYVGLEEVERYLHRVAGYQSQQVTWHSGPVLQTVVSFRTMDALSWLGRAESLLQEARLSPLPGEGIYVGGARVKNITVGGLHTDVCSWLFTCPSGFQCVSSEGNASCSSVCHSEYCKHQGICVHRSGQQPLCQCPVGEDFWFMGQRCDLRMTRQRLVGVCFAVLLAVALLMAVLCYLVVRRFKTMLVQAKVDQTRSSYRRFNHFDELSARFWGRSWPGSEDSLDNPAFTRSDEILHMRALDHTCCYHDDTMSITSTYQGSVSHLNTVYPHSSHYRWDLSNYSLADGVVDSGKASDLSVCSWPIEPIQWTPFPLLQQLSKNTASVKASRPRSYCEGMELVELEKSWTA
ncbi:mucin-2 isoform X1 [Astyanax mexicanus]|uniref:mucin-2 isoform X1 n=1 Tax=Astyanax mexicanus TaxID=7994 RepID=UPI0020CB462E|nr:mucin-2 isoform X1 [Astyanax mexicanus]